jgi:rhodanese-related sulfurtransferase
MSITQKTSPEAHAILRAHPDAVYLDVRSEPEFEAGHPAGALNVPISHLDAAGRPVLNSTFVADVERVVPKTTKLIVGCQVGGRSQRACEMLEAAGWTDLTNVVGGFGGARDATGRLVPGWRDAGLPVETGRGRG